MSPNSRKNCRHCQNQTCRVLFTSYNVSNTPRPTVLQEAQPHGSYRRFRAAPLQTGRPHIICPGEGRLAMVRLVALLVGLASGIAVPASAQDKTDIEALRKQGYSVRMISPIFGQLVMLSLPKGFTTVFEDTSGSQYTREAVLDGESVERWSQMITVTGAKGLASNPRLTAQSFVEQIAGGFKNACPDTFSAKGLGALRISGRDAFIALAACGTVASDG